MDVRVLSRLALVAGSVVFSSAIVAAVWPDPRLSPSVSRVAKMATDYQSRDGYYTYVSSASFTFSNEKGEQIPVEIDEQGLRNPSGSLSAARIIVLGDSFAAAINTCAAETFAAHLARLVGQPVYNAGVDGFSTFQETRLLRHLIRAGGHAQSVVLLFYLGNDFRDNFIDNIRVSEAGWMGSWPVSQALGYQTVPPPGVKAALRRTGVALEELKALCAEHGMRLLVVGVPSRAEVFQVLNRDSDWGWHDQSEIEQFDREARRSDLSFDAPDFRLRTMLAVGGLEHLSLLEAFRSHREDRLYGKKDSHWTPEGQRLAAELVAQALARSGA